MEIKSIPFLLFAFFLTLNTMVFAVGEKDFLSPSQNKEEIIIEDTSLYEKQMADLDPLEPLNRGIFMVNTLLDSLLFRPMAYAYQDLVPEPIKNRFSSFLNNLGAPVIFINDILQGKGEQALNTFMRFFLNTTFGILGLFDVASEVGLDLKGNSFETTFRRWGIGAGPYIVLPLFGPSSFRNLVGDAAEHLIDPYNWYMRTHHRSKFLGTKGGKQIYTRLAVRSLIKRYDVLKVTEKLDKTEDPYAQYRILYMQHRKIIDAIENSAIPDDMISATAEPTINVVHEK